MPPFAALALVLAQETTTTEVPRAVGDPWPAWVMLIIFFATIAVVVGGGLVFRHLARRSG